MRNLGFLRQLRDVAIVVLLLAVPFFFLRASIRKPEEMTVVDRTLMRVAAPIQNAVAVAAQYVSGAISTVTYLLDVKSDNDRLAFENARLKADARALVKLRSENRSLRKLLALRNSVPNETVSALVIGKETTEYFRVWHLTLDKPNVVLKQNMPVIASDGVVGTVLRSSGDRVDVRLTVDSGFGVDVVVQRTGARGFVKGVGDRSRYVARVEFVQRRDEINVGDLLVTSGLGCRFPEGLPVAKVTKVVKRDYGIYQSVEAVPTVDYSRLGHALIVLTARSECTPVKQGE